MMKTELARILAVSCFRASAEINNLVPLIMANCDEAESEIYVAGISEISFLISQRLLRKVFDEHPTLEQEFEERFDRYGRPA